MGKAYQPPFQISPEVLNLTIKIVTLIGRWDGASRPKPKPELRKQNKIRTIQSSLAIEGNTLTLDQMTAILEERPVIGPKKDIIEVQNAIKAYETLAKLNGNNEKDFLKLHKILMNDLLDQPGRYRLKQVGVLSGSKVVHVAPASKQVPHLMGQLFEWVRHTKHDPLIVSCITHYEIEFIHPFSDGNGRMGRLWQGLILQKKYPIFEFTPIETVIKKYQMRYYNALQKSNQLGESTPFLLFMMEVILEALEEVVHPKNFVGSSMENRLDVAKEYFGSKDFSRTEYMKAVGNISTATASRDLQALKDQGLVKTSGSQSTTRYQFKK